MAEKFVRMSLSESACTLSRSWTSRLLVCLVWLGSVACQISGNLGYYLHETTYNAAGPATVVTNHLFTNSTLDKGVMVVLTDGKVSVNRVTSSAPSDIMTASADEIRANTNICGADATCVPGTGIGTYDALLFVGRFSTLQEPAVWMYNIETNIFTQFPDPTPQFGSLRFIIFVPGYSNPNKVLLPGGSEGVSLWDFVTTPPLTAPILVSSSSDNIPYLSGLCTGGTYCYLHSRDV